MTDTADRSSPDIPLDNGKRAWIDSITGEVHGSGVGAGGGSPGEDFDSDSAAGDGPVPTPGNASIRGCEMTKER